MQLGQFSSQQYLLPRYQDEHTVFTQAVQNKL